MGVSHAAVLFVCGDITGHTDAAWGPGGRGVQTLLVQDFSSGFTGDDVHLDQ